MSPQLNITACRHFFKYSKKLLLPGLFVLSLLLSTACTKTVYVHQQQQSYNDYKAQKYSKVKDKTKWPNRKKKRKKN